jgi:hypothetical protein
MIYRFSFEVLDQNGISEFCQIQVLAHNILEGIREFVYCLAEWRVESVRDIRLELNGSTVACFHGTTGHLSSLTNLGAWKVV